MSALAIEKRVRDLEEASTYLVEVLEYPVDAPEKVHLLDLAVNHWRRRARFLEWALDDAGRP